MVVLPNQSDSGTSPSLSQPTTLVLHLFQSQTGDQDSQCQGLQIHLCPWWFQTPSISLHTWQMKRSMPFVFPGYPHCNVQGCHHISSLACRSPVNSPEQPLYLQPASPCLLKTIPWALSCHHLHGSSCVVSLLTSNHALALLCSQHVTSSYKRITFFYELGQHVML